MEFLDKKTIRLDKVENQLDKFVLDFLKILERHTKYVIVSGYVAILFGRNRASEDVDVFVDKFDDFSNFASDVKANGFWFLNTDDINELFSMIKGGLAIRVAKKDTVEPNFEIKLAKKSLDFYSMENRIKVLLANTELFIAPIELSIAFKLFLSSEKDIEDARFLFGLFKDKLDMANLNYFLDKLEVRKLFERHLWKT